MPKNKNKGINKQTKNASTISGEGCGQNTLPVTELPFTLTQQVMAEGQIKRSYSQKLKKK